MPAGNRRRAARRDALKSLLLEAPRPGQRELVEQLVRLGHDATQSSVSRDLRDLGVVKTARGYELPTATARRRSNELGEIAGLMRSVNTAGPNLLVIRTAIGAAQRVALVFDRGDWTDIVGTVAGDDTIFVATSAAAQQRRVLRQLGKAGVR